MTTQSSDEELAEKWISELEYSHNKRLGGDLRIEFEHGWRDRMKEGYIAGRQDTKRELEAVKREYFEEGQISVSCRRCNSSDLIGPSFQAYEQLKQSQGVG